MCTALGHNIVATVNFSSSLVTFLSEVGSPKDMSGNFSVHMSGGSFSGNSNLMSGGHLQR